MWCSATRGLHHAGQNYSASIRLAVLTEFALTPQALPDWQLRGAACMREDIEFGTAGLAGGQLH
jgi:hypothetical protein